MFRRHQRKNVITLKQAYKTSFHWNAMKKTFL